MTESRLASQCYFSSFSSPHPTHPAVTLGDEPGNDIEDEQTRTWIKCVCSWWCVKAQSDAHGWEVAGFWTVLWKTRDTLKGNWYSSLMTAVEDEWSQQDNQHEEIKQTSQKGCVSIHTYETSNDTQIFVNSNKSCNEEYQCKLCNLAHVSNVKYALCAFWFWVWHGKVLHLNEKTIQISVLPHTKDVLPNSKAH